MSDEKAELERRIAALEYSLSRYHDILEATLEHDRSFQLKATWGVVTSVHIAVIAWLSLQLINWLDWNGIIEGVVFWAVWLGGAILVSEYSDRGRLKDEKKLGVMPKWKQTLSGQDNWRGW